MKFLTLFLVSFLIAVAIAPLIIPFLHKIKFGQSILEDGPVWHKKKSGTPTMGGFIFIIASLAAFLLAYFMFDIRSNAFVMCFVCSLLFGILGFLDDFVKVVLKRNMGLSSIQKLVGQIIITAFFLAWLYTSGAFTSEIILPFIGKVSLGYLFIPYALFVIVGFNNAVNLTDGLDGLAASITAVVMLFYSLVAYKMGNNDIMALSLAVLGALVGFLIFNAYPAKVFMGDTGSLFLGGIVILIAFSLNLGFMVVIFGFVYAFEAISVIMQVLYFKKTKKRIFKMTPIHHHFEMCGWSERKIVLIFTLVTLILSVISYLLI